jgi:hypothetical protein
MANIVNTLLNRPIPQVMLPLFPSIFIKKFPQKYENFRENESMKVY